MATSIGQYAPVFLSGEPPSLTEKPGRPQSTGWQIVKHYKSNPVCKDTRLFYLWQHWPSKSWVWRWCSNLACGDPGRSKCAGTQTASAAGIMALSVFFWASCSWRSEGLFGQCFSITPPIQAIRELPCLGLFSVVWCIRHIEAPPLGVVQLCRSVHQALKGAPWVGSYSVVQWVRR